MIQKILIAMALISLMACSHLQNGYNEHILFTKQYGRQQFETKRIENIVFTLYIVDHENKMPCLYSHWNKNKLILGCASGNNVYVKGVYKDSRYIIPPAILGHEIIHLIENAVDVKPVHQYGED